MPPYYLDRPRQMSPSSVKPVLALLGELRGFLHSSFMPFLEWSSNRHVSVSLTEGQVPPGQEHSKD